LNTRPTLCFGHFSHQIFLQVGHCQGGGLRNPPIWDPHLEQKPLTTGAQPSEMQAHQDGDGELDKEADDYSALEELFAQVFVDPREPEEHP